MKDRQPTQILSNGAIRYGVYTAGGTLDHYVYLKREDAPTVEGTPLNKANLLSDATAAKIWPDAETRPEDPTVSEALIELRKGASKIGDILMTARAKPSDAWLLCNGQTVTKSSYPQLFALLKTSAGPAPWTTQNAAGVDRKTFEIKYTNGKWFAFAYEESARTMHMYVSEDASTWTDHSFHVSISSGTVIAAVAICYHALANVYYVAVQVNSGGESYCELHILSGDLQTATEKSKWIWNNGGTSTSKLELYISSSNNLYCVQYYGDLYGVSTRTFTRKSSDNAQSWGTVYNVDAADYDETLGKFCWAYQRNIYMAAELGNNSTANLIGTIPTTVIPSNITEEKIHKYICVSTNTVIAIYQDGGLKYAYSIDNGVTWHSGTESISTNSADYVDWSCPFEFVSGLLLLTVRLNGGSDRYTCSVSDPADQVYKTSGGFEGALSPDGLAAEPPESGTISVCNYADSAKPVPKIIPDSRSHAYIKALEE